MRMRPAWTILMVLALPAAAGEGPAERVRRANELLRQGDAKEALRLYREAQVDRPGRPELAWNTGIGEFREGRTEEALKAFDAARVPGGPAVGGVDYQRGVVLDRMGKLEEALEAFRAAVRADPKDADARFNYETVRRKLEQQKKQDQENKDDQKQDEQQKDDEKQEQKKQDQEQQDQKKDEQQKQEDQKPDEPKKDQEQPKQEQEQKDGKPAEPRKLSPEEAKRLMERLAREEKEYRMDQIRKAPVRALPVERDW